MRTCLTKTYPWIWLLSAAASRSVRFDKFVLEARVILHLQQKMVSPVSDEIVIFLKNGFIFYTRSEAFMFLRNNFICYSRKISFHRTDSAEYDCGKAPVHCECWYERSTSQRLFLFYAFSGLSDYSQKMILFIQIKCFYFLNVATAL